VQRYVRYGKAGLIVCSSTRLEDVPASDTFTVEDTLSVRESGEWEIERDVMTKEGKERDSIRVRRVEKRRDEMRWDESEMRRAG
jgi:hypothetical protein